MSRAVVEWLFSVEQNRFVYFLFSNLGIIIVVSSIGGFWAAALIGRLRLAYALGSFAEIIIIKMCTFGIVFLACLGLLWGGGDLLPDLLYSKYPIMAATLVLIKDYLPNHYAKRIS